MEGESHGILLYYIIAIKMYRVLDTLSKCVCATAVAGFQRMSTAHSLHGFVDPPRDTGSTHSGGGGGGHLHPQPEPAARGSHGPAVALPHHLDARCQECTHDHLR